MTNPPRPRVIALGLLIWRDHLLLQEANLPGSAPAWRAPGGGVEHGEYARDAVVREFLEETGRTIEVVEALPVVENIFRVHDQVGHEAVFPFHVRWAVGQEPDNLEPMALVESDGTSLFASWFPLAEAISDRHVIYPDGFANWFGGWLEAGTGSR